MRIITTVILLTVSLIFSLSAEQKEPPKALRILALGDGHPFIPKIENGVRKEQPAPEGELPPNGLMIQVGAELQPVNFSLKKISPSLLLPAELKQLKMGTAEAGGIVSGWFSRAMPESKQSLLVLWRDQAKKKWDFPKGFFLKDDVNSFPSGAIRFTNVSDKTANVKLGKDVFQIKPGKVKIISINQAKTSLEITIPSENRGYDRLIGTSVSLKKGERCNAFIYSTDGKSKKRAAKLAKVLLRNELANVRVPKQ